MILAVNLKQEILKHLNSPAVKRKQTGSSYKSLTTDTAHDSSTTSTVNMLTSTKMLKIKQGKIDTRKRENRKIATKNLQLDTYSWISITYFLLLYFYSKLTTARQAAIKLHCMTETAVMVTSADQIPSSYFYMTRHYKTTLMWRTQIGIIPIYQNVDKNMEQDQLFDKQNTLTGKTKIQQILQARIQYSGLPKHFHHSRTPMEKMKNCKSGKQIFWKKLEKLNVIFIVIILLMYDICAVLYGSNTLARSTN